MERRMLLGAASAALVTGPQWAWAGTKKEINIAYVKSPFNLQNIVMKEKGLLEREFASDRIRINWHDINSGAKQTQALAAGALDISAVMNTASLLLAAGQGNRLRIATGVAHPGNVFAIVGRAGEQMRVADLRGKTVVGPRGTVLHQVLVAALARSGMSMKDVDFVSMDPPMAYAALASGKVDAALLAAGLILRANAAGMKTITTAQGLVSPNLVMVAGGAFAQAHEDLLARVVRVHRQSLAWIRAHRTEALSLGAAAQGVDAAAAASLYEWSGFYDVLTAQDIEGMRLDQAFLLDNGMMSKPVADLAGLVLPMAMR